MIEICTATICACVPAIRALLARWLPLLFDTSTERPADARPRDNTKLTIDPFPPTWIKSASRYNEINDGKFSIEFELSDNGEKGLPAFNRTAPLSPLHFEEAPPHTPRTMQKIWAAQHEFDENHPPMNT